MKASADAMLREVFGSDERYRVLRTLYEQPERALPLRRLASAAQVDPGNASKLLKRLALVGLCERVEGDSHPTFRAPRDNPLLGPLSALFIEAGASQAGNNELPEARLRYGDQDQRELNAALALLQMPAKRRGRSLAARFGRLQARANSILSPEPVHPGILYFKSMAEKNRHDEDLELERAVRHARASA